MSLVARHLVADKAAVAWSVVGDRPCSSSPTSPIMHRLVVSTQDAVTPRIGVRLKAKLVADRCVGVDDLLWRHGLPSAAGNQQQDDQITHVGLPFIDNGASIYFLPRNRSPNASEFFGAIR